VLFIAVVYLSWFTWFVSRVGGGGAVYALYYLPVVHAAVSAVVIPRSHALKPDKASAMLTIGGVAFFLAYFLAHQVFSQPDQPHDVAGISLDLGVFNLLGILPAIALAFTLLRNPHQYAKPVAMSVMGCLFIDAVLTYRLVQTEPLASKVLATVDGMTMYGSSGASGFFIANSVAVLLPAFLSHGTNKRERIWWLASLGGVAFIYTCGYLLTVIAVLISILAYYFFLARRRTRIISLGAICLLLSAFASGASALAATTLDWLSLHVSFYEISRRLSDLSTFISTGASDDPSLERFALYQRSWDVFQSSPIFGAFASASHTGLSGHSTVLDVLASMGLVGFLALLIAVVGVYLMGARLLRSRQEVAGLRASYATLFFIALVNPVLNSPAIVFSATTVVPLLCYLNRKNFSRMSDTEDPAPRRLRGDRLQPLDRLPRGLP